MLYGKNEEEGRVGEWMQVASGGKFFPLDPRPEEIHIDDIANALALTCRYGGQGNIDKFYSVAEHSILMARHCVKAGMNPRIALGCLLHDASEAYTGDLVRAMKHSVGPVFGGIEDRIQEVIFEKYGVTDVFEDYGDIIKNLDMRVTVNEKAELMNTEQVWATDDLKPLDVDVRLMSPRRAKVTFINCYDSLRGVSKLDISSELSLMSC